MPSGRTHDIINLSLMPVAAYYLKIPDIYGFITGYLVGTFILSPDNDLYHSLPVKRWKALRFIWYPYSKFSTHRGLSHFPFLGSILRLLYLAFILLIPVSIGLLILYFIKPQLIPQVNIETATFKVVALHPFTVSFFIGLFLSEIIHIITDMLYSMAKRLKLIR
ncbi:MAG: metal-binding protein [Aquificae bacterium]|nr:metal-binding protein [Aquificota bacterium]